MEELLVDNLDIVEAMQISECMSVYTLYLTLKVADYTTIKDAVPAC